jgi:hypothetical protein
LPPLALCSSRSSPIPISTSVKPKESAAAAAAEEEEEEGRFGLPVGEPREEEMQRRRGQTWAGVGKTAQAAAAHAALFCFTLLLALRVDGRTTYSWWYAL